METGLSVDITAVAFEDGGRYLLAKGGHNYRKDAVFPLEVSTFEMEKVYLPRDVPAILAQEYGEESLQRTIFHWSVGSGPGQSFV
jgi:hypothetical protein